MMILTINMQTYEIDTNPMSTEIFKCHSMYRSFKIRNIKEEF